MIERTRIAIQCLFHANFYADAQNLIEELFILVLFCLHSNTYITLLISLHPNTYIILLFSLHLIYRKNRPSDILSNTNPDDALLTDAHFCKATEMLCRKQV